MLPLYNTPHRPQRKSTLPCLDSQRKHVFILSGLVLMSFTLVLILLINSEISPLETESYSKDVGKGPVKFNIGGEAYQPVKATKDDIVGHQGNNREVVEDKHEQAGHQNGEKTQVKGKEEEKKVEETENTVDIAKQKEKERKEMEKEEKEKEKEKDNANNARHNEEEKDKEKTNSGDLESQNEQRRQAIVDAFKHAYGGYKEKCWGQDELLPVSGRCRNWFRAGLSIIDALDTMYIMGLKKEFEEATQWVEQHFNFNQDMDVSVFETNIRIIGGFLSAFDFSKNRMFLDKAKEVADRLLPAFDTSPVGIPSSVINLKSGRTKNHGWAGGAVPLADIGTLQMEWAYLSHHTGDLKYAHKALNIYKILRSKPANHGALYGIYIHPSDGSASTPAISLGAPSDSFYEYLLKVWLLLGKKAKWVGEMWEASSAAILQHMAQKSGDLVYPAQLAGGNVQHRVEQLACFAGGMFALGSQNTANMTVATARRDFAAGFTSFCHQMYRQSGSGLAPEYVHVNGGKIMLSGDRTFQLRPETIESIFYMWRLTGDQKYRDWSWEIFEAITKHCKVPSGGFSGIIDIHSEHPGKDDMQPSWFFAEVLKYFYLTFSPNDVIPLDKYVFNTESHPLSVISPDPSLYDF